MNEQATIAIPFAIGEKLWHAGSDQTAGWETCQCCQGKLRITIILGDGSQESVECEMCRLGYLGASGKTQTYRWRHIPIAFTTDKVSMSGEDFNYRSTYDGYSEAKNLFRSREECQAKCDELNAAHIEEERNRHVHQLISAKKKMAWSVGYWRNQLKKREEECERIRERLGIVMENKKAKP